MTRSAYTNLWLVLYLHPRPTILIQSIPSIISIFWKNSIDLTFDWAWKHQTEEQKKGVYCTHVRLVPVRVLLLDDERSLVSCGLHKIDDWRCKKRFLISLSFLHALSHLHTHSHKHSHTLSLTHTSTHTRNFALSNMIENQILGTNPLYFRVNAFLVEVATVVVAEKMII